MSSKKLAIKTDFHIHLLPDIDCSGDPVVAASLVKDMCSHGLENVVLTPHFYPQRNNSVDAFLEIRDKKIESLYNELDKQNIKDINFFPAAEVLLCENLEKLKNIEKLCISGTKTILIEMPDWPWKEGLIESLINIRDELKLDVVVAHVDRYGKENAMSLIKKGFMVQLNSDSIGSLSMRGWLKNLIKSGYVYAIGSDQHVHSDKKSYTYQHFPKASAIISEYSDLINSRSLKLIGK